MDRIDLCVELQAVDISGLIGKRKAESSADIRARVMRAREIQAKRFEGTDCRFNSDIQGADIERYCPLGREEQEFMEQMYRSLKLSARAYHRILKVARTVADLAGEERLSRSHLLEASFYRPSPDYWR